MGDPFLCDHCKDLSNSPVPEQYSATPPLSPVHRLVLGEAGEGGDGFGAFTGSMEGLDEVYRG